MRGDPVPGDVHALADPDPVVPEDEVEESHQRRGTRRVARQPTVQTHREHLRGLRSLRIEDVEGIPQVGEELLPRVEALGGGEAHVVGVQGVGHDEVGPTRDLDPVGQVVGVGVGVVEEAAVLDDEAARIGAVPTGVPAERRGPVSWRIASTARRRCSRSVASSMDW